LKQSNLRFRRRQRKLKLSRAWSKCKSGEWHILSRVSKRIRLVSIQSGLRLRKNSGERHRRKERRRDNEAECLVPKTRERPYL